MIKSGPPSYMAAQWDIDNLDAPRVERESLERLALKLATEIPLRLAVSLSRLKKQNYS